MRPYMSSILSAKLGITAATPRPVAAAIKLYSMAVTPASNVPENIHWDPAYTEDEVNFIMDSSRGPMAMDAYRSIPTEDPGLADAVSSMPDHGSPNAKPAARSRKAPAKKAKKKPAGAARGKPPTAATPKPKKKPSAAAKPKARKKAAKKK